MGDSTNSAAWQPRAGTPLEVGPAEVPIPGEDEILVRNRAIAINPVDWILQDNAIFPCLDYPEILGSDVAGQVAAICSGVTAFKVGDRVLGPADAWRIPGLHPHHGQYGRADPGQYGL